MSRYGTLKPNVLGPWLLVFSAVPTNLPMDRGTRYQSPASSTHPPMVTVKVEVFYDVPKDLRLQQSELHVLAIFSDHKLLIQWLFPDVMMNGPNEFHESH
ncbi:hypothetical protein F2Q69_00016393 [Brassica cretica]|uniref:Uncharacterized protein n=1 Tax=Brassica cretica TaxID=69181 RepID=A0A8S9QSA6_BRACR|nr:hypothetical protein F2Q69_00016393 [Brassica cretica]